MAARQGEVMHKVSSDLEEKREAIAALRAPMRKGAIYFENIADINDPQAGVLELGGTSLEVENLIRSLGTRGFLHAEGGCVLAESSKRENCAYAHYLKKVGLLDWTSIRKVVWVDDPTDFNGVLAKIAEQSATSVVPYMHRLGFLDIAGKHAVSVHGNDRQIAHEVVEKFGSKSEYRNWVDSTFEGKASPIPRISLAAGDRELNESRLSEVIAYAKAYNRPLGQPLLFLQLASAGGGTGNFCVVENEFGVSLTNSFFGKKQFESWTELGTYLENQKGSIEITPYVEIVSTYTLGLNIGSNRVDVIGPLDQIVEPDSKDYCGWKVDIGSPSDKYPELSTQIARAERYALELQSAGYRGWADEDLFVLRDPQGNLQTGRSESNLRRDAMTQLIGYIADSDLGTRFLDGKLAVLQNDHAQIDRSVFDANPNVWKLAKYLRAHHVPLFSAENREGVLLLTNPIRSGSEGNGSISVAIVASSNEMRDDCKSRVEEVLNGK